jgi:hypothetical protein
MSTNEHNHAGILSGSDLLGRNLPEVRRGGVDAAVARALLEDAAATIDSLNHHIDTLGVERSALLESDTADVETPTDAAARVLVAAERVASEIISSAQAEAEDILAASTAQAEAAAEDAERAEASRAADATQATDALASEVAALTEELAELLAARAGIVDLFQAELFELRSSAAAALQLAHDGIDAAASQARSNLDEVVAKLTEEAAMSLESFGGGVDVLLKEDEIWDEVAPTEPEAIENDFR